MVDTQINLNGGTAETVLRKLFNKVSKIIYVDPDTEKIITHDDGHKEKIESIPFCIDVVFYLLMSQYFKKIKIKFGGEQLDLRVSSFLIRPSRSGKGQIIKIIEEAGKNLKLKVKRISYLNQASLIGSLDETALKHNAQRNLKKGSPGFRDPVMYGALANADILVFPEAKKLVKGTNEAETEFILSTLQEALDYPGFINKELKYTAFPIAYESTVSVFATTYYIAEIADLLMEQGFFQRVIIEKKTYDLETIKWIREQIINKFKESSTKSNFPETMKRFTDVILSINNTERELTFSDESIKLLHRFNDNFFKRISKTSGKELEILKSFSQTIIHMCVKIAGINCCLRYDEKNVDNVIREYDMTSAITMFNPFSTILITQMKTDDKKSTKTDDYKNLTLQCYKKFFIDNGKEPLKGQLADVLRAKGLGINRSRDIIDTMIMENYFTLQSGEGNEHILKINDSLI